MAKKWLWIDRPFQGKPKRTMVEYGTGAAFESHSLSGQRRDADILQGSAKCLLEDVLNLRGLGVGRRNHHRGRDHAALIEPQPQRGHGR